MKILSLDTSTEACTAAVWVDGNVYERFEIGASHSEHILNMVNEVLAQAGLALMQLDGLAYGRGPGSFTGVRIGAGVIQGLGFAADLPIAPVSSLAALAQGVSGERILPAFDARMKQVYWGAYIRSANGLVSIAGTEQVIAPHDAPVPEGRGWTGAGSGWDCYASILEARLGPVLDKWQARAYPHAGDVARLGDAVLAAGGGVAAEQALPVYIRDNVARPRRAR